MSNHRPTADEDVPAGTFTQLLVLEELLPDGDCAREPLPYLAGFAAGKAFVRYRRAGEGKRRSELPTAALRHTLIRTRHIRLINRDAVSGR